MTARIGVLGIAGSPRRHGNSTTLLRAALGGATEAGATTALVRLYDVDFRGCQACPACPAEGCRQRDGFQPVLAALSLASVWMFASPVYFDGVSGPLKCAYDRLYWFRRQGTEIVPRLQGPRRAALLLTYEDPENPYYTAMAERLGQYFPGFGEFPPAEVLGFPDLGPPSAAARQPELLERATELGRRLVGEIVKASF
jgi:multimeric flavodoxin WrbA